MSRVRPGPEHLLGVAVVVPAHDEQDVVVACLDAVAAALARLRVAAPQLVTTVVVALDSCGDATAERIARARPEVATVAVDHRAVGAARAAGTAHALARLGLPPERVWTAHTDADSVVPPHWLVSTTTAADLGVDAVLGTVVPDDALAAPARGLWSALHPPHEGHPYVHGANLAVRASALAAVGGWRPLRTHEDADLARRLRAHPGLVVRSSATAPVVTSSRSVARAPGGFASYLRAVAAVTAPTADVWVAPRAG